MSSTLIGVTSNVVSIGSFLPGRSPVRNVQATFRSFDVGRRDLRRAANSAGRTRCGRRRASPRPAGRRNPAVGAAARGRRDRAVDLVIIRGEADRQHDDARGDRRPRAAASRLCRKAPRHGSRLRVTQGVSSQSAKRKQDVAARGERPPVEADLRDGPGQRADQHGGIDPQSFGSAGEQQSPDRSRCRGRRGSNRPSRRARRASRPPAASARPIAA